MAETESEGPARRLDRESPGMKGYAWSRRRWGAHEAARIGSRAPGLEAGKERRSELE
jgi:hypothetical protein